MILKMDIIYRTGGYITMYLLTKYSTVSNSRTLRLLIIGIFKKLLNKQYFLCIMSKSPEKYPLRLFHPVRQLETEE